MPDAKTVWKQLLTRVELETFIVGYITRFPYNRVISGLKKADATLAVQWHKAAPNSTIR